MGNWILDKQKTEENRKSPCLGAVYTCSRCGNEPASSGYGSIGLWLSPFCPWCGDKKEYFDVEQEQCDEIDREIYEERCKRFDEEISRAREEDVEIARRNES